MNKIILCISLLILFTYGPATAEFYKYTDADGNVRFTDDLSKVPESQRPNVTSYEESESSTPAPSPKKAESDKKSEKSDDDAASKTNASLNDQRGQIQRKQENLKTEYQGLMEEKAKLAEESKGNKTPEQRIEIERKVKKLNEKIVQYDKKREALNSEIEAFNVKMSQSKEADKK